MSHSFSASTVRIITTPMDDRFDVVGTGFLVSKRHIITCAHVVIEALDIRDEEFIKKQPEDKIYLNLFSDKLEMNFTAHVICWCPPQQSGKRSDPLEKIILEDIAVLELDEDPPDGTMIIHCVSIGRDVSNYSFQTFGFPLNYNSGTSSRGDRQDIEPNGWIKLGSLITTGDPIEGGFSGAPLWSDEANGVVGMIVKADTRVERRVAFAIPTEQLIQAWPGLQKYINNLYPVADEFRAYLQSFYERLSILPPYYPDDFDFDHIRQRVRISRQRLRYREEEEPVRKAPTLDRFVVKLRKRFSGKQEKQALQSHEDTIYHQWRSAEMYEQQAKNDVAVTEAVVLDWETIRTEIKHVVILGDPGSGKSWLLKYEGRFIAQEQLKQLKENTLTKETVRFPIFLGLGILSEELMSTNAREAIIQILKREYNLSDRFLKWIREWLNGTGCVLLLDALDEVAEDRRSLLREALKQLSIKNENHILLTSRIVGYQGLPFVSQSGKWKQELELVTFDRELVRGFIKTWFERDISRGKRLQNRLQIEPSLRSLARIPLMLSFLCVVTAQNEDFPTRRAELYETVLSYLLEKDKTSRDLLEDKLALLEYVAWYFATLDGRWHDLMPAAELDEVLRKSAFEHHFLEDMPSNRTLLTQLNAMLIKAGEAKRSKPKRKIPYLFLHRTFHEYLVARYLAALPIKEWTELIRPHLWFDSDWKVVIILLAGCLNNPNPLLEMLLNEPHDAFHTMLFLAGECLVEAERALVKHEIEDRIVTQLLNILYSYSKQDLEDASSVLGKIGESAVEGLLAILFDKEHQIALSVREVAAETLGRTGSPHALEGLLSAFQSKERDLRSMRYPVAQALGRFGTSDVVDTLLKAVEDARSYTQQVTGQGGLRKVEQEARELFLEKLAAQEAALAALGQVDDPRSIEVLLAFSQDDEFEKRQVALGAMRKIGDWRTIESLLAVLQGTERLYTFLIAVHDTVAEALGKLGNPVLAEKMLTQLRNFSGSGKFVEFEEIAALVFGRVGDAAVNELLSNVSSPDAQGYTPYERWEASLMLPTTDELPADELMTMTLALVQLWKALEETALYIQRSDSIRADVARALGQMGDSRAVAGLREALHYRRKGEMARNVRQAAAEALGRIGDPRAVEDLMKVLLDEEGLLSGRWNRDRNKTRLLVGEAAARALGKIGDPQAIDVLLRVLQDTDEAGPKWNMFVCRAAAEALGQIGDSRVKNVLLQVALLYEEDPFVRNAVIESLGQVGDQQTIEELRRILRYKFASIVFRLFEGALRERIPLLIVLEDLVEEASWYRWIREEAERVVLALGLSSNPYINEALQEALTDKDRRVRKVVKEALGHYNKKPTMRVISANLRDNDVRMRLSAFEILGQFSDARAVETLLIGLRDKRFRRPVVVSLETLAQESDLKMLSNAISQAWSYLALDDSTYLVLYELLKQQGSRLRDVVGDDWSVRRVPLAQQTNYVLQVGLRRNITRPSWFIKIIVRSIELFRLLRNKSESSKDPDEDHAIVHFFRNTHRARNDVPNQMISMIAVGMEPTTAGWLCYFFGWVTGILFFFLWRKNHFVRFHSIQSVLVFGGLSILEAVSSHLPYSNITINGLDLLLLVCWAVLMTMARLGLYFKVPLIGDLAEKLAGQLEKWGKHRKMKAKYIDT